MSRQRRANLALAHFGVLFIFGIAVTLFLVHKINQVADDLETLRADIHTFKIE